VLTRGEFGNEQHVQAYFSSAVFDVDDSRSLDVDDIVDFVDSKVEHWNSRRSCCMPDRIIGFTIVVTKYRPLSGGSSFLINPLLLVKKQCRVNVKHDDYWCRIWRLLARSFPKSSNLSHMCHYQMYKKYSQHRWTRFFRWTFEMSLRSNR